MAWHLTLGSVKPFEPVKHPKSEEERSRIRDIISANILFRNLDETQANVGIRLHGD